MFCFAEGSPWRRCGVLQRLQNLWPSWRMVVKGCSAFRR